MSEDKSDETDVRATEQRKLPLPLQPDLPPEVTQLQIKVADLKQVVESLKSEVVGIRLRQFFLKAIVGWKEGEKAPLSEDVLTGLREYAKELGITV